MKIVSRSVSRLDGKDKVTGRAKYVADLFCEHMLVGKILGSQHASARVIGINKEKALQIPGVIKVLTHEDAPQKPFTPVGHAYNMEHPENENMHILTSTPRFVGDPIAAIIAEDEASAERGIATLEVQYEVYEPILDITEAQKAEKHPVHTSCPNNVLADFGEYLYGEPEEAFATADANLTAHYEMRAVKHGHIEPCASYVYIDREERINIVSSTQIPFYVRKRTAQALGIPERRIRIVKPYLGGGFGNKQDALYEPLNALMSLSVGGRAVRLALSMEETMLMTRTRYAFDFDVKIAANQDGILQSYAVCAHANGGAYATHGHSIALTAMMFPRFLYKYGSLFQKPVTYYTNVPAAGAMRGYGSPQGHFAVEAALDDMAQKLGIDPLTFRLKNLQATDYIDPPSGCSVQSNGLRECLEKGAKKMKWQEKRKAYEGQTSNIRGGIGVACFAFVCSTYPFNAEVSGARVIFNEDGSFLLSIGATEIGQGSDTALGQIAAETLGVGLENVVVLSQQDTDISPYDGGAFATRQTFTSGNAVLQACTDLKHKILNSLWELCGVPSENLDIVNGVIVDKNSGECILSLSELATHNHYNKDKTAPLASEVSLKFKQNVVSFGCTFAEVEVDIRACKVKILNILNVHDSGRIINPVLAAGQVHGGMGMGIGQALFEQVQYNNTGKMLTDNLLDYKIPTSLDLPNLQVDFVEKPDPRGPYGAKGIGEPPNVSPISALRNALLNATGVSFNSLPVTPQTMYHEFVKSGLIEEASV